MIEQYGDIWELADVISADVIVVTTNGDVNKQQKAVMGRGIALEAAKRYPTLPIRLGRHLLTGDNTVRIFPVLPINIVTFPVKHHWHEIADVELIERSAVQLQEIANVSGWKTVLVPRPGCGNGGLKWEYVKPLIEPYLDDRFIVVTRSIND